MSETFENIVSKKLLEADIPFDPDAWIKMELLLNDRKKNKFLPVWWLFLFSLLGGMIWYTLKSTTNEKKLSADVITQQTIPILSNSKLKEKTTLKPIVQEPVQKILLDYNQPAKPTHASIRQRPGKITNTPVEIPEKKDNIKKSSVKEKQVSPEKSNVEFIRLKNIDNVNVYTKIKYVVKPPVNRDIPTDQTTHQQRKINNKGLYFAVTLGPDMNVAPSLKYGNIGFNAGGVIHYYFDKHWFVTTGVVYSKKVYGATSAEYRSVNNTMPFDLVKVNAYCDVIDIPINANYTFLQVNNNTISATLGLSNYFMLKEKYQYIYEYSSKYERTIKNENQHYLSILNIGALYQHPTGKRLIIGIQPYVKIPLHGIGAGQVRLYSAGANLQLQFFHNKY